MKNALLFHGGWDGHQPEAVAERVSAALAPRGVRCTLSPSLDCLNDAAALREFAVIIPCWTMGALVPEQSKNLLAVVREGVALAGIHGGAGDAFRGNIDYEWMVGGHFVGHPHIGDYEVRLTDVQSPITAGLPSTMRYRSEQYYLLVDPGNTVLAETDYTYEGRTCRMPVAWTKMWGKGRVFYSALGHDPKEFDEFPETFEMAIRGMLWAADCL